VSRFVLFIILVASFVLRKLQNFYASKPGLFSGALAGFQNGSQKILSSF